MQTSQSIAALAEALALAQAEITNPHKNREVTVQPREGRPYSFAYATLDGILDGVRPILAKHGLSIVQALMFDNGNPAMRTTLLHKSGEFIATDVPMHQDRPGNQALGSAMTYARRYGLIGLLALAADEDDDANNADGNTVQASAPRAPAPGRQAPPAARNPAPVPPSAPAAARHASEAAQAAAAEFGAIRASLEAKMGKDEATHQIDAIKKRNGDDWRKTLAEVRALNDSTPAPKA